MQCLFISLLLACSGQNSDSHHSNQHYITWQNVCFDRCASIWLIHTHIDSSAHFSFIPFGNPVRNGIPFDVPGAELGRHNNVSCFESIIKKYQINDPQLLEMAKIVHDIDVNIWAMKRISISDSLNKEFNKIKANSSNDSTCLINARPLFQSLYTSLKKVSI